jgi:hypothetical protein
MFAKMIMSHRTHNVHKRNTFVRKVNNFEGKEYFNVHKYNNIFIFINFNIITLSLKLRDFYKNRTDK